MNDSLPLPDLIRPSPCLPCRPLLLTPRPPAPTTPIYDLHNKKRNRFQSPFGSRPRRVASVAFAALPSFPGTKLFETSSLMPHSAGAQLHEGFHKVLAMFSHTQDPCYGDSEAVFLAAPIVPLSPLRSRLFLTRLRAKLMNFDLFFMLPFLYLFL